MIAMTRLAARMAARTPSSPAYVPRAGLSTHPMRKPGQPGPSADGGRHQPAHANPPASIIALHVAAPAPNPAPHRPHPSRERFRPRVSHRHSSRRRPSHTRRSAEFGWPRPAGYLGFAPPRQRRSPQPGQAADPRGVSANPPRPAARRLGGLAPRRLGTDRRADRFVAGQARCRGGQTVRPDGQMTRSSVRARAVVVSLALSVRAVRLSLPKSGPTPAKTRGSQIHSA